jgi:coenzyme F420-reducing hydrogenase delta subunit/heterodisulfide reductase subunit C
MRNPRHCAGDMARCTLEKAHGRGRTIKNGECGQAMHHVEGEFMEAYQPNSSFAKEVLAEPGGENLYHCLSCGTCGAACLVRRVNPDFNPNRIIHMVMLGMREEVLSSPVIWLCSACDICYERCPQEIHISHLMRAIRDIAIREGYEPPGPIALVDEELCSGCGICATACPYEGIELVARSLPGSDHAVAQVDKFLCMNCGTCAAACPSGAIRIEEFSQEKVAVRMQAGGWFLQEGLNPKIMVFICNWCLRAGDDLDYLHQLPPNIRIIDLPCTGRMDPSLILTALKEGADGVLMVGCEPGECHYQRGNLLARRRIAAMRPFLGAMGVGGNRLGLEWIAASDRGKIKRAVSEFIQVIEQLGPNPSRLPVQPAAGQVSGQGVWQ